MKIFKKVLVYLIFPLAILGLAYLIVESVMEPVRFNKEKESREQVAIQRLKDIRTLQNAYKTECGKFTASFDTLKSFYTDSSMKVVMQLGSADDSVAVANTENLKKRNPRIKPEQMLELYRKGERLVFLARLPRDEAFDIGMVDIEAHHLRRATRGATALDGIRVAVETFQEAHDAARNAAARKLLALGAQGAEVRSGARSALEELRLGDEFV